ncbi:MAG: PD-(D/E)XK nuclease family protein [Bacteroidales bacterium]|nr:PD-(D/E)XK nuclease family protein [Bacteroidales bacterium]
MQSFLEKTGDYIINNIDENISDICIVLPNRRASLFLKKHISNKISKPVWSPEIFSIEDFICKLSGYRIIDRISLLFEFYETHKTIEGKDVQEFENFMEWGSVLLHDFNEIDQYLVDPEKLFGYLTDAKAISIWNLDMSPLTEFQHKYLKFYNSLIKYYNHLSKSLLKKNLAYQGLAYREVNENIYKIIRKIKWKKIVFAGFNALTTAEENIIKTLIKNHNAEILWDADNYYLSQSNSDKSIQEAGFFLRKHFNNKNFSSSKWIENNFRESEKEINIIGIPKNIGQAKICGDILSNNKFIDDKSAQTAIALADENLLMPVLNSIPESIREMNITMGLPLQLTPLADLFESIFAMHDNATKLSKARSAEVEKFYLRDILKIIQHSFISGFSEILFGITKEELNSIKHNLIKSSNIFFSKNELIKYYSLCPEYGKNTLGKFFSNWENPSSALANFSNLISAIKKSLIKHKQNTSNEYKVELEYLFNFSLIIKRLKDILNEFSAIKTIRSLRLIFKQIVRSSNIPFFGEPLKGLQIMGILETRTLDFENLIMLSVNEDIIPKAKNQNSFIPFEIKKIFKLPTYKDRNAVYAYHFYRLLQRSKNIYLLYNTEPDTLGGGEKSRFIHQIIHELEKYNPKININEKILALSPDKEKTEASIQIKKTNDVLEKIRKKADSGFSASSLNTYINCPLQFYFRDIAKIREIENIEETIDSATLGNVIHKVLKELFEPYKNIILQKSDIDKIKKELNHILTKTFETEFNSGNINFGKNLLIVNVAKNFINDFLKSEKEFIRKNASSSNQLHIKHLEENFKSEIIISNDSSKNKISAKIIGTVDRIDVIGNTLRIIDYKTGKTQAKELNLKDWEELKKNTTFSKSFQLLIYTWLYFKNHSISEQTIEAGIIPLSKISNGILNIKLPDADVINQDTILIFENELKNIITEIFNPEIEFKQTQKADNCKYCAYKVICER